MAHLLLVLLVCGILGLHRINGSAFDSHPTLEMSSIQDFGSHKRKRARSSNEDDHPPAKLALKLSRKTVRSARSSRRVSPSFQTLSPGISNMGETCYFSSLLQVTSHIPVFTSLLSWIAENLESRVQSLPDNMHSYYALLVSFLTLVDEVTSPEAPTHILPNGIFEAFRAAVPSGAKYELGVQQDAEEALSDFINALNDGVNALKEFSETNTIPKDAIVSLFKIHIINHKKCTVCSSIVTHDEPSLITWLSVPRTSKIIPLETLLRSLSSPELVEDVACETCAGKHNANSFYGIVDPAPPVLLIGLKRFEWNGRKVLSKVSLPIHLDLSTVSDASGEYTLTAMILHHGARIQSGHYTSQFFDTASMSWIDANDEKIRPLSRGPDIEQSTDVYIIVYSRKTPN